MTQTGDTNQLISNSGYIYMPSRLSCLYFSLWGHYQLDLDVLCSLKTILETLQKLKGFIIRLDMQYSNVAWKPNWTGSHLCILRPMPAHSKWITGGLSQCLRHSVLNLDRKKNCRRLSFFRFPSLCPLRSWTQSNCQRATSHHKDDGNGNLGLFISEKKEPRVWKPHHSAF